MISKNDRYKQEVFFHSVIKNRSDYLRKKEETNE